MTDFNNLFQMADLSQQRIVQGTADIGGGYLPISLTASPTHSLNSAFSLISSLNNIGTPGSSSPIQTKVISSSVTSSSQSDVLLGITASVTLVDSDTLINTEIATPCGKKNQPNPSW